MRRLVRCMLVLIGAAVGMADPVAAQSIPTG
jgi:hypothetical protein